MTARRLLTKIQLSRAGQYHTQRFSTQPNGHGAKLTESRQRAIQLSHYFNDPAIDQAAEQPLVKLNAITMMYSSRSDDQTHILRSSSFLRRELPIRLAHLVKILRNLPFIVACNPSILDVIERYIQAFKNFENVQLEIKDQGSEEKFTEQVRSTLKLNKDILALLADGFRETRRYIKNEEYMKNYLNQILTARMATRILCEHHLALHQQAHDMASTQQQQLSNSSADSTSSSSSSSSSSDEHDSTSVNADQHQVNFGNSTNWVGIINKEFSPRKLVEKSSKMVSNLCRNKYGLCPKIKIDGHINAKFPYIPMPIEYILPELLKNAYRATVEHNRHLSPNGQMPDVSVTIAVNEKDCVIRIRDRGGGIPHSNVDKVFDYHFTTSSSVNQQSTDLNETTGGFNDHDANTGIGFISSSSQHGLSAMHGYGFGLPTSKAYAEYLGGSITFQSLQGIGSDFYLRLALFDAEPYIVKI